MKLEGEYKFPNQGDTIFKDPEITIDPIVRNVDPLTMTIHVDIYIPMEGSAKGRYYIDINPVPVNDLNYDVNKPQELIDRIVDRSKYFKQDNTNK